MQMHSLLKISAVFMAIAVQNSFSDVLAQDIADLDGGCFGIQFAREDGPTKEIAVSFRVNPNAAANERDASVVNVEFSEWDAPGQRYTSGGFCRLVDGKALCGIECDGGSIILAAAPNGELFYEAWQLMHELDSDAQSVLRVNEADGRNLTGLWTLKPRKKEAGACSVKSKVSYLVLEAGDISPRVREAEKKLSNLGYFLLFDDDLFDQATAKAVTDFQRNYNLPKTGKIDHDTSSLMNSLSKSIIGGC